VSIKGILYSFLPINEKTPPIQLRTDGILVHKPVDNC